MNIKIVDLKKFKSMSSNIKGNGILPIQDYLKFGKGLIQKEVTSSFLKFNCADATEEILVDEKMLYDLVDKTDSDKVTITHKKGKTTLSDGKYTFSMQVPDASLFVDIPTVDLDKHDTSVDFLEAIGSAAQVCNSMTGIPDKYMYVMVGNKCVTGISISYGYCRMIEEDFKMSLEKRVAAFVSGCNVKQCSISDSHYIFYTDHATMGFAMQEIGYGDFGKSLRADPGKLTFTACNSDIRSYNSLAISLCKDAVVTMSPKGALEMYDALKDIPLDAPMPNIKPYEEFHYLPAAMNLVLTALDTEELDVYQKDTMLLIRSRDTNAIAAIGKIKKQ